MKSILNNLLRAIWRGLAPIRRPFVRKFDEHINRVVNQALSAELDARLVPTLGAALETTTRTVDRLDSLIEQTARASRGTDSALGKLLDELVRLRRQVDLLQQIVQPSDCDIPAETAPLNGVPFEEPDEATAPFPADPAEERASVEQF